MKELEVSKEWNSKWNNDGAKQRVLELDRCEQTMDESLWQETDPEQKPCTVDLGHQCVNMFVEIPSSYP